MGKSFRWPGFKKHDGGATNKHTPREDPKDTSTSPQHTITALPEHPKPSTLVVTSNSQSPADRQSSSLPSPHLPPSSNGPLPPALSTSLSRAATTSTPQNVRHGKQQAGTLSGTNATKKDYWHLAIEKLQEEDPSVVDQIAGVQEAALDAGDADFALQLLQTTRQSQQALEAKKWKINTGSRNVVLRDQFDRLVKGVTLFKDVINAAGSIDPLHAGLPLAGFCVLMQVWPVTCCTRVVRNTDMVLDGDQRFGTVCCNGCRRRRDCHVSGTISTDRSTVLVTAGNGFDARF